MDSFTASLQERMYKGLNEDKGLTYGEICFESFLPMFNFTEPKPGEIFYDLGCGNGAPLLVAAIACPSLASCKGIELLSSVAN